MNHSVISLMQRELLEASWGAFQNTDSPSCQERKRQRMLEYIRLAIYQELTPRQRECLLAYYISGEPVRKIAGRLGVTPWTVYKHIERGVAVIRDKSRYLVL